jgi:hypothetical protein
MLLLTRTSVVVLVLVLSSLADNSQPPPICKQSGILPLGPPYKGGKGSAGIELSNYPAPYAQCWSIDASSSDTNLRVLLQVDWQDRPGWEGCITSVLIASTT